MSDSRNPHSYFSIHKPGTSESSSESRGSKVALAYRPMSGPPRPGCSPSDPQDTPGTSERAGGTVDSRGYLLSAYAPSVSSPAPAPHFDPSEESAAAVNEDFLSPELSFPQIARRAGTTLMELVSWMSTPETEARLRALEESFHRRTQLHIARAMPIIEAAQRGLAVSASMSEPASDPHAPNLHRRRRHRPRKRGR